MTAAGPALGWGFVGTGAIAGRMAELLRRQAGSRLSAVTGRDPDRVRRFAADLGHDDTTPHPTLSALLEDPRVDVVYVASPPDQHADAVRAALLAGKAVLCEKPMTTCWSDTAALVELARSRGVFLMEAVWMRFDPLIARLRRLLDDGAIGRPRTVTASFGLRQPPPAGDHRWRDGALLDLGVYPVSLAQLVLGEPDSAATTGHLTPDGIESDAALLLGYPGGASALLACSLATHLDGRAGIAGTSGRVELGEWFVAPTELTLLRGGAEPERFRAPHAGMGYLLQLREVAACVRAGATESAVVPLRSSLATARVIQDARDLLRAPR